MSELEEMINSILGDPVRMEQVSRLAQSLTGGDPAAEAPAAPGIDLSTLGGIKRMMSSTGSQEQALLEAMKPWMSEKRRRKMDKAMMLARLAKLAELAADGTEADGDG